MAKVAHQLHGDDGDRRTIEQFAKDEPKKPVSGRDLLAALESAGIIGMWADRRDIGDSSEYATQLRRQAQQR